MSTPEVEPVEPLGRVVGENVRRLREGMAKTQAELARWLQGHGLYWQRSHVAALEAGNRETLDAGALWALAYALEVPIAQLFEGDGDVRVTADSVATRRALRDAYGGQGVRDAPRLVTSRSSRQMVDLMAGEVVSFQADADLAEKLGLKPQDVYEVAERLWGGRNLQQERDRRVAELGEVPAGARGARRGHVTRQLIREITPHLPTPEQAAAMRETAAARYRPFTDEELETMQREEKQE